MRPARFITDAERTMIVAMLDANVPVPQISKLLRASNTWVAEQIKVIRDTSPKSADWPPWLHYEDDPHAIGDER